jgi:hypothetical protein
VEEEALREYRETPEELRETRRKRFDTVKPLARRRRKRFGTVKPLARRRRKRFGTVKPLARRRRERFGSVEPLARTRTGQPPASLGATAASPHAPLWSSGLVSNPFGKPLHTRLIAVPSHAQPALYASHVTPGAAKHCPLAEQASASGNPQISVEAQSELVEHAFAPASVGGSPASSAHDPVYATGFSA